MDNLEEGQVWIHPEEIFFTRVHKVDSTQNFAKAQQFGLTTADKWQILPETTQQFPAEWSRFGYLLVEEYLADSDWMNILKYISTKQPSIPTEANPVEVWQTLKQQSGMFEVSQIPVLSPKDIEERKNKLLDQYSAGEITKEKLQQEIRRLESSLKAFMPSPSWDGGFLDGPSDLGKNPAGDFPTLQWMPRGQEDASVNEDISVMHMEPTISPKDSYQRQLEQTHGKAYGEALTRIMELYAQGESLQQSIDLVVQHLPYHLDKKVLEQAVNQYLKKPGQHD